MADEDYTLTIDSGRRAVFHVRGSVQISHQAEVITKPTEASPTSSLNPSRKLPPTLSATIVCIDGGDGATLPLDGIQSESKEAQAKFLEGLVGREATFYSRSTGAGFEGVVNEVTITDNAKFDNILEASLSAVGGDLEFRLTSKDFNFGYIEVPLLLPDDSADDALTSGPVAVTSQELEDIRSREHVVHMRTYTWASFTERRLRLTKSERSLFKSDDFDSFMTNRILSQNWANLVNARLQRAGVQSTLTFNLSDQGNFEVVEKYGHVEVRQVRNSKGVKQYHKNPFGKDLAKMELVYRLPLDTEPVQYLNSANMPVKYVDGDRAEFVKIVNKALGDVFLQDVPDFARNRETRPVTIPKHFLLKNNYGVPDDFTSGGT